MPSGHAWSRFRESLAVQPRPRSGIEWPGWGSYPSISKSSIRYSNSESTLRLILSFGNGLGSRFNCSRRLLDVVQVQVHVHSEPDYLSWFEVCFLREEARHEAPAPDSCMVNPISQCQRCVDDIANESFPSPDTNTW